MVTDRELEAIVIGAGWAGLSVSHALKLGGLRHLVLERNRVCETWRAQRWNSFRMNTPNIMTVMPGDVYAGNDPEGFQTRDEFVELVESFARRWELPVETNMPVTALWTDRTGCFHLVTPRGVMRARNVVIATGNLNIPKRPPSAARLPASVSQIDASDYREAAQLRPGAVLVIGCGNSGGQIADDLARAGRPVFLSTGHNGRIPRRYRNRDIVSWLVDNGRFGRPRTTVTGRPLLGATHTISLQSLSAEGVVMLGRFAGVQNSGDIVLADDLLENARFADQVSADIKREIDAYIEQEGISAPAASPDEAELIAARFPVPPILSLDLVERGITTVIWCTGFIGDFRWVHVPGAIDASGKPSQTRCISVAGVYFAGLDSTETLKAGSILVAEEESKRIAEHIAARLKGNDALASAVALEGCASAPGHEC